MKHRTTSFKAAAAIAALFLAALVPAVAQTGIPRILSYQGLLTDRFNVPVADGTYGITIRLYETAVAGLPVWEEQTSVTTFDGVFSTLLGESQSLSIPFDRPYWLGLELNGEAEMTPRIPLVASPYAFNAVRARVADSIAGEINGVVRSVNDRSGSLRLVGEGGTAVRESGDTIFIAAGGDALPVGTTEGDIIRWNAASKTWEPGNITVETAGRLSGDGTSAAPLDIARMGASPGDVLRWDATANGWTPGPIDPNLATSAPIAGNGTTADPIRLDNGHARGQTIYWDGTVWKTTANAAPADGEVMRWDAPAGTWIPGRTAVSVSPRLTGEGTPGSPVDIARQGASDGQVLRWDAATGSWSPGDGVIVSTPPFAGEGTTGAPLRLQNGSTLGQLLFWNGSDWILTSVGSPANGQMLAWNASAGLWEPTDVSVTDRAELSEGAIWTGSTTNTARELLIGSAGAVLAVNATGSAPEWSRSLTLDSVDVAHLDAQGIRADSITADGLDITGDVSIGRDLTVTGAIGVADLAVRDSASFDGPVRFAQFPRIGLARNSMIVGDANDMASELATSSTDGAMLRQDGNGAPLWSRNVDLDTIDGDLLRVADDASIGSNLTVGNDLTVNGTNVNLPNGSIDNPELANSTVNISYGTGISGDASVSLGGTLNLRNDGITQLTAGNGITVDQATGDVTISNNGLLAAAAGNGISVNTANGTATIVNTGVTALAGTANQVAVDQATGSVTLSLPQDIHTDARPTFDGLTLDNITNTSSATDVLVSNGGSVESRTFTSLIPGGLLPTGTSTNSTLRWDGTAWVENSGVTADAGGNLTASGNGSIGSNLTVGNDLTVNGTNVNLPNGSIDNAELANSTVNISYGTGISGDASVSLGGTFNLRNDGVTQLTAGNGITVDQATGDVTISNNGLLAAAAGNGISVSTANGTATIANTGVTALAGTVNQVAVDQATGSVTLSLPQDIHTDARPRFDGLTLDNITNTSSATDVLVSNAGSVESRTFTSLIPGGLLPTGTSTNSTLRWDGTAWVENSGVTADAGGNLTGSGNGSIGSNLTVGNDLTVNGTNVNLPNGSIDNAELANSTVNISYGSGISGDASVSLGGTLNLRNDGVTQLTAGNGITVDQATGDVTISNNGLLAAAAGNGISVNTSNGTATIVNTGVTALAGTANQVAVNQATGSVTLSLPQDIHTDATPRFDGLTLDNINTSSSATDVLVSNAGSVESRTFASLFSSIPLNYNAMLIGNSTDVAIELASTNDPNALLRQDGNGTPEWTSFSSVVSAVRDSIGGDLWKTDGNAGTDPSTDFIGTTDNRTLVVRVDSDTALRIVPGSTPSLIGGSSANILSPGVEAAVIGGGGSEASPNMIGQSFATIAGGRGNRIDTLADASVIGGGHDNRIDTNAFVSTISGGRLNHIGPYASRASIGGGSGNTIDSGAVIGVIGGGQENRIGVGTYGSVIAGGHQDTIQGNSYYSIIGGGQRNTINNAFYAGIFSGANNFTESVGSLIGGGETNRIETLALNATIGGGEENIIRRSGRWATISGGRSNLIDSTADYASVDGGQGNVVGRAAWSSTVGGGYGNLIGPLSINATVGGGEGNGIPYSGRWATVAGGRSNRIDSTADYATISGGQNNVVERAAWHGTIGGGLDNKVRSTSTNATISGGRNNRIDTAANSTIGGGQNNLIGKSSTSSTIGGGHLNEIGAQTHGSVIAGGEENTVDVDSDWSAIGGGHHNRLDSSRYSAIPGGRGLTLQGDNSFGFLANPFGSHNMTLSDDDVAVFGNTDLWIASNDGTVSKLKFFESNFSEGGFPGTTNYSSFEASGTQTANLEYILPDTAGAVGDILAVRAVSAGRMTLDWAAGGSGNGWSLTGNTGTNASTNFIGTADNQPLIVRVNNDTVMQYRHDALSPIIVGGFHGNSVGAGSYGSIIAGGGLAGTQATIPEPNTVGISSEHSTISGGWANLIDDYNEGSTVSGGKGNEIRDSVTNGTIGGGRNNIMHTGSQYATIGGGLVNDVRSFAATIGGGHFNSIGDSAHYGTVAGGYVNTILGNARFNSIGGGSGNSIRNDVLYSTIAGGYENDIYNNARASFIGGGDSNYVSNGGLSNVVTGGNQNRIHDTASYSTIGGGRKNAIERYTDYATIVGGSSDTIKSNADFSTITGGVLNTIGSGAFGSTIAGGFGLTLNGSRSFGYHANSFFGGNPMQVDESYTAVFGNVHMWLANNDSVARQMRFYEPFNSSGAFPGTAGSRSFYTSFQAPLLSDTIEYVLPATAGSAGDVMEIASVTGDRVVLEWDTDDNSSDIRFKRNVRTLENALTNTLRLRGVRHDWRREDFPNRHFGDGEAIGFIAQEVEEIFPELVETESDGYKKVRYAKVTALLVEALREQQDRIERQDREIAELRGAVEALLGHPISTEQVSAESDTSGQIRATEH